MHMGANVVIFVEQLLLMGTGSAGLLHLARLRGDDIANSTSSGDIGTATTASSTDNNSGWEALTKMMDNEAAGIGVSGNWVNSADGWEWEAEDKDGPPFLEQAAAGRWVNVSGKWSWQWSETELDTRQNCSDYLANTGCSWTKDWSCAGQPVGQKGVAKEDGHLPYECCCKRAGWMEMQPCTSHSVELECPTDRCIWKESACEDQHRCEHGFIEVHTPSASNGDICTNPGGDWTCPVGCVYTRDRDAPYCVWAGTQTKCHESTKALVCPEGSVQSGTTNNDIAGCGLQQCEVRFKFTSAQECQKQCSSFDGCKAFTWAPYFGDKSVPAKTVCTLYDTDIPTSIWGPAQIFCKMQDPKVQSDGGDFLEKLRDDADEQLLKLTPQEASIPPLPPVESREEATCETYACPNGLTNQNPTWTAVSQNNCCKDPEVQSDSGDLFEKLRDDTDEQLLKLTPQQPSIPAVPPVESREEATCATYACPNGWTNQNPIWTVLSQGTCCQVTCAAYACPNGWTNQHPTWTAVSQERCCQEEAQELNEEVADETEELEQAKAKERRMKRKRANAEALTEIVEKYSV